MPITSSNLHNHFLSGFLSFPLVFCLHLSLNEQFLELLREVTVRKASQQIFIILPSVKKVAGQKMSMYRPALPRYFVPVPLCDLFTNTIPFFSSRKTVPSTIIPWELSMASQALLTTAMILHQSLPHLYPKLLGHHPSDQGASMQV